MKLVFFLSFFENFISFLKKEPTLFVEDDEFFFKGLVTLKRNSTSKIED